MYRIEGVCRNLNEIRIVSLNLMEDHMILKGFTQTLGMNYLETFGHEVKLTTICS